MITVRNVHKAFGTQLLFEAASLQINAGDRFALVGPNGAGKSTFFKMLLGETEPDGGEIQFKRGAVVGYLPQENPPVSECTIVQEVLAHTEDHSGKAEAKAKAILMGLGFKATEFEKKVNTLSGGWAMRVAMARLLLQEPDLIMLDEPTNHLDLDSLFWFQNYLLNYRGAIFLISHDRHFMNAICKAIVSYQLLCECLRRSFVTRQINVYPLLAQQNRSHQTICLGLMQQFFAQGGKPIE